MIDPLSLYIVGKATLVLAGAVGGFILGRAVERLAIADVPAAAPPIPVKTPPTVEGKRVVQADPLVQNKQVNPPKAPSTLQKAAAAVADAADVVAAQVQELIALPIFKDLRDSALFATFMAKMAGSEKIQLMLQSLHLSQLVPFLASIPGFSVCGSGLLITLLVGGGFYLGGKLLSGRLSFMGELRHVWEDIKEFCKSVIECVSVFCFHPLRV